MTETDEKALYIFQGDLMHLGEKHEGICKGEVVVVKRRRRSVSQIYGGMIR